MESVSYDSLKIAQKKKKKDVKNNNFAVEYIKYKLYSLTFCMVNVTIFTKVLNHETKVKQKKARKRVSMKGKRFLAGTLASVLTLLSVCSYPNEISAAAAQEGKITVHYQSQWGGANIFYWNQGNGYNNPVSWPGVRMEKEEDNWYVYTFDNTSSVDLMFNFGGKQTTHYNVKTGEYWLADGTWREQDPTKEVTPEPTKTITSKPTQEVTLEPTETITPKPTQEVTLEPTEAITPEPTKEAEPTEAITPEVTKEAEPTETITPEVTKEAEPTETVTPEPTKGTVPTVTRHPEGVIETPTPIPAVKGKMILHYYSTTWDAPSIYFWGVSGGSASCGAWPGDAMEAEGDGWYTYTVAATSANLIFNDGSGKELSGQEKYTVQTADLTQKEGEWWYKDGKWFDYDPNGPTPTPKPTNTPKPTATPRPTRDPNCSPTPTLVPSDDFRDETIYFVMTTRFYDGDPSNNVHCWDDEQAGNPDDDPAWRGDFKGLIEQLDYIKALGFTAIWITPVVENTSGYDYHGYHASNFSKVDSRYESEDCTYQDLIDAVHAKGMKIIQDVVFNHTGNFGEANLVPMFTKVGDQSTSDCLQIAEGSALPSNYEDLKPDAQYQARLALMKNTDGVDHDTKNLYHHYGNFNWDEYDSQLAQIAGDCVDLNTENPLVYNYLIDAYTKYIDMGVDGFRVDTAKHISRLTFNMTFNKAFKEAGGDDFFMFGEVCARDRNVWYRNTPGLSTPFYTWAETKDYGWSEDPADALKNVALTEEHFRDNADIASQPTSDNALLAEDNQYHETDYSQFSGLSVIDFPMHWNFNNARDAFGVAVGGDKYYNDASWNVTYVDSHDYAPDCAPESQRFSGSQDTWAENLNLMFTFRGIPCIYYGSEIEFMKGAKIDVGPNAPLSTTGRAYFGDNLEGTLTTTDFGEYTATGKVAETLSHPLSLHIQRLNKIRAAIPALRKGQYSVDGVNGDMAFKRRYTNEEEGIDSFVCVSITNGATFTDIPNGTYVDAITGEVQEVTDGTLSIEATSKGNMRVYVLSTELTEAPGRIGEDGMYLN